MPKPTDKERRKQILKEREAEYRRDIEREQASFLVREASVAQRDGDVPAADRILRRVLILDPDNANALNMLAAIHEAAGHHGEALGYLRRLRKLSNNPLTLFNMGVIHQELGQTGAAVEAMRDFVAAAPADDPNLLKLRRTALALIQAAALKPPQEKPAPAAAAKPSPPAAPPAPKQEAHEPELRVPVQFLPTRMPEFEQSGSLADFFLSRQWLNLRMAQSFEQLLCLPSIQGVDAYIYQQEAVRKVLRQLKGRALLADEVGLGKTIEACLVLKEYWVRGMVRKALVLTPPSLVSQWKGELEQKFALDPASPDGPEFRQNPTRFWQDQPLVVASIAQARLDPHADLIAAVPWDMVIVDEAHCLKNRTSSNWKLVDSLQKKFILMLTATPVENNLVELYNLITLLKPGLLATEAEFKKSFVTAGKPKAPKNPDRLRATLSEVMVRNTRAAADVQLPHRIAASVVVEPTSAEAQVYERVSRLVASRYKPGGERGMSRAGLDLMQRQAGSSAAALRRAIGNALSGGSWASPGDRRELEGIMDLTSQMDGGSKGAQLGHMLAGHPGKAVVFTEFVPTLEHLQRVCQDHGISCSLFSGDLSRAEKDSAIARFRDESRVLLSTGAGGEGRNLQFADTVVNFDLPWNPMRIEQRVGRVHRIGQTRDVFVFNFCQQGTVEEQLLRVLHDKINMFELVVGEMDAILGTLDDGRDFAEIVMDLWIAGRESGDMERAFEDLARRLTDAKQQHRKVQELDEALFARDFEV